MSEQTSASNPVVDMMNRHTSVRRYEARPVDESICQAILQAAFAASSSCFMQVTSIIRVTDPKLREKLAVCAGNQKHVLEAPEFWVFVADYHRNRALVPEQDLGWCEQLMVGCTDTAIIAQSAMTALESFGLGGVFVGGLRNGIDEVAKLLRLPPHTLPLLGLSFGWPAEDNEIKPRLPMRVKVMTNRYVEAPEGELEAYNEELAHYYAHRKLNPKQSDFKREVGAVMQRERRPFVDDFARRAGWLTH